jgi:uncharacterized repeat protein (TIGR03803 family)
MTKRPQPRAWISRICRRATSAALALAVALIPAVLATPSAQAQTVTVLYTFTGGADGAGPGNLIIDSAGVLYGTAGGGLSNGEGAGVVYKVDPATGEETVLTTFTGVRGGAANPIGTLARDSSGHLYGTAANSGKGGRAESRLRYLPGEEGPLCTVLVEAKVGMEGIPSRV